MRFDALAPDRVVSYELDPGDSGPTALLPQLWDGAISLVTPGCVFVEDVHVDTHAPFIRVLEGPRLDVTYPDVPPGAIGEPASTSPRAVGDWMAAHAGDVRARHRTSPSCGSSASRWLVSSGRAWMPRRLATATEQPSPGVSPRTVVRLPADRTPG
jgi:hypothetical protein